MYHGRLLQVGTPREIYEQPGDAFVADFVGSLNDLVVEIGTVEGGLAIAHGDDGDVIRVPVRRAGAERAACASPSGPSACASAACRRSRPAGCAARCATSSTSAPSRTSSSTRRWRARSWPTCSATPAGPRRRAGEAVAVSWPDDAAIVLDPEPA